MSDISTMELSTIARPAAKPRPSGTGDRLRDHLLCFERQSMRGDEVNELTF